MLLVRTATYAVMISSDMIAPKQHMLHNCQMDYGIQN
jgi:hypothetical protein